MKKFTLLILCMIFGFAYGQDPLFVHTATASNISANVTYLDHPDLNGNPNARIIVNHNWNPPGSTGVYNDNVTGVWYDGANWTIYNENVSLMIEGSSYNIYIAQGSEAFTHVATAANQGTLPSYSILDHPDLNGFPNALPFMSNYYNPNNVYNTLNTGFWYDGSNWNIYTEGGADIPLDAAFFIAVNGENVQTMKHIATVANSTSNWTNLDHPLLNGNPDAIFVFDHNWGTSGDPENVIVDNVLGAWYTGSNWAIYSEDGTTPIPENAAFNVMIYDPSLGITDNSLEKVVAYPNPVTTQLTIETINEISSIEIYNILGQKVMTVEGYSNKMNLDVSNLNSGTYLAKIISDNTSKTIKIIKV